MTLFGLQDFNVINIVSLFFCILGIFLFTYCTYISEKAMTKKEITKEAVDNYMKSEKRDLLVGLLRSYEQNKAVIRSGLKMGLSLSLALSVIFILNLIIAYKNRIRNSNSNTIITEDVLKRK